MLKNLNLFFYSVEFAFDPKSEKKCIYTCMNATIIYMMNWNVFYYYRDFLSSYTTESNICLFIGHTTQDKQTQLLMSCTRHMAQTGLL